MRPIGNPVLVLAGLVAAAAAPPAPAPFAAPPAAPASAASPVLAAPAGGGAEVKIFWDERNVPYVVARSDAGALYGQGWALAECQYAFLKAHYAKSNGYLAKYFYVEGSDLYKEIDFGTKQMRIPETAEAIWQNMPSATRDLLWAYVRGINDYYQAHAAKLDAQNPTFYKLLRKRTTPQDVIGAGLAFYVGTYLVSAQSVIAGDVTSESLFSTRHSNAWAMRADRSASGNPLLFVDPHIILQKEEKLWTFLCGLFSPNLNAVGYNQLGLPFIVVGAKLARPKIAGDRSVAWTITAGPVDQVDVYRLQTDAVGNHYWYDGQWEPFEYRDIGVELADHSIETRQFKYSVHGPVLQEDEDADLAWAIRHVLDEQADLTAQFHAMLTAHDADEFVGALGMLDWAGGNIVVATNSPLPADQIRYVLAGPCPQRSQAIDWTQAVDGSTSSTLWTSLHPLSEMPQATGAVQDHFINNNAGVDNTWAGFAGQGFPTYMVYDPTLTTFRQERAQSLLSTGTIDVNAMLAAATDKSVGKALYAVPLLMQANDDFGDLADDPMGILGDLIDELDQWDKRADVGSTVMPLFAWWEWLFSMFYPLLLERPDYVPAALDQSTAVDALNGLLVAAAIRDFLGSPTWGDVHRTTRSTKTGPLSFPVGGAGSALRAAEGTPNDAAGYAIDVFSGQTCPIVVELGPTAASTTMLYTKALDNATSFMLPTFGTQNTQEWAAESYQPLFTTPAQAEAGAVRSEVLTYVP